MWESDFQNNNFIVNPVNIEISIPILTVLGDRKLSGIYPLENKTCYWNSRITKQIKKQVSEQEESEKLPQELWERMM